jgi:hypothetical protein
VVVEVVIVAVHKVIWTQLVTDRAAVPHFIQILIEAAMALQV